MYKKNVFIEANHENMVSRGHLYHLHLQFCLHHVFNTGNTHKVFKSQFCNHFKMSLAAIVTLQLKFALLKSLNTSDLHKITVSWASMTFKNQLNILLCSLCSTATFALYNETSSLLMFMYKYTSLLNLSLKHIQKRCPECIQYGEKRHQNQCH